MFKNTAGQKVGAQLVSKTDGSAITSGTTTVYYTLDAGTQTQGSVGSGAATHEGQGYWTYAPSQGETNGDQVAYTFVNTSAVNATVQVYTFPEDAVNTIVTDAIQAADPATTNHLSDVQGTIDSMEATLAGTLAVNVTEWAGDAVPAGDVPGAPNVNCVYWQASPLAVPAVAGFPKVAVTHWVATAVATPTVNGVPEVDVTHWAGSTSGTPNVNVTKVLGETATALQTGKIWYVHTSGNSSNPGSRTLPLDTFANAQTAASFGDTVFLLAGTYPAITITKDGLHVRGEGDATHLTSGVADTIEMGGAKNVTVSNLKATQSGSGITLQADEAEWCSFYDLNLVGGDESFDVFGLEDTKHAHAYRVRAYGEGYDTVTVAGAESFYIDGCWFEHHGTSLTGTGQHSALFAASGYGHVRNTDIRASRIHAAGENGRYEYGISLGTAISGKHSTILLENVRIDASSDYTGSGGRVFGVATLQPGAVPAGIFRCTMIGGHINASNAGSGGAWDVHAADDLNLPVGQRSPIAILHGVNRIGAGTLTGNVQVLDTNITTIDSKLNSNFTTLISSNTGNRTITDLTTPVVINIGVDD